MNFITYQIITIVTSYQTYNLNETNEDLLHNMTSHKIYIRVIHLYLKRYYRKNVI